MRLIPNEELAQHEYYADLAPLAVVFNHAAVEEDGGTWRWQKNALIRFLLDGEAPFHEGVWLSLASQRTVRGALSLNDLWRDFHHGKFSLLELMKFYMGMNYSLSGFCEVFGQRKAIDFEDGACDDDTCIEYVNRVYAGNVLQI